jgi:outer membrane protein OmpA-like peptidoglycan-associated protein
MGFTQVLHAQNKPVQLGKTASDCLGALMINDTVVGPVYSPKGFGNKLEISGYELGDPYFIEQEHNTVWYKFRVPYDAIFTFDLIPVISEDDFDFLLFQYDGPNFCRDVQDGTKIPIRTNISRKNQQVSGKTGLNNNSVDDYVPSGPGSSYSRALSVKKGELYYLLVDNPFRENEGHTIYLHFKKQNSSPQETTVEQEEEYEIPLRKLEIAITDASTGNIIASDVKIDGLPDSVRSRFPSVSQVEVDVLSYRTYSISAIKKGYLLSSTEFIPKNDSIYRLDLKLKPMKVGDRINLENVKFDSDKTVILEKSIPALEQLYEFMQANPQMSIELQGHVNGEGKKNKRKFIKLSKARAEAIKTELVQRGVDSSRLNVVGYGNSKMIYPTPINNRQAEANRRVEAEVTSL